MKKGVSPLIATVLIIAFVIAVVVIANTWLKGFTKERIEDAEKSKLRLACAREVKIEITNLESQEITIENKGKELQGFTFIIDGGTPYDDSTPLEEAGIGFYELEDNPTKTVKVIPLLGYENGFIKCGDQTLTWNVD